MSTGTTTRILCRVSYSKDSLTLATEPFDEILDRRIKGLVTERVSWDATVAERRKRVPMDIHGLEADLENRRSRSEWLEEGDDERELPI